MIKNLRTKKSLRILATKSVTSVASYEFRTVEEINEFAKNLRDEFIEDSKVFDRAKKVLSVTYNLVSAAITRLNTKNTSKDLPSDFVKPNMDKLAKSFEVIDKYQDKIDSLDSVINTLTLEFSGERGAPATLKQLKDLRSTIKKKLDAAYKFLSDLAKNHEPKEFRELVSYVADNALKTFSGHYESAKHISYLVPQEVNKEQYLLISHYIEFKNFEADDFVAPTFYLIINAQVNLATAKIKYFVNTMQNFTQPGRVGLGVEVKDKREASTQSLIMMELEGFTSLIERTPIPTHQTKLNEINWSVPAEWLKKNGIKLIDNDVITVEFTNKVTKDNIQDAANHFIRDLKTAIIPNNYRMQIRPRKNMSSKPYSIDFIFVLPDAHQRKEIRLDAKKVKALKDMFGMTDKQASDLIKHFNNM